MNKTCVKWRCKSRNCSSSLTLSIDSTAVRREPSNHSEFCKASQSSKITIEEAFEIRERRAREETTSISKIYTETIVAWQTWSLEMPTESYFRSCMSFDSLFYRHRAQNYPTLLKVNESCIFLRFLVWYTMLPQDGRGERILTLGSRWRITFLLHCAKWHATVTICSNLYHIFG